MEWVDGFEKTNSEFNYESDALISNSRILFPGRFYILHYNASTEKTYNGRPIILSLGLSKKDPNSFLCLDICLIPKSARLKFVQYFFNMFEKQIIDNMEKFWNVEDADKQRQILQCSYEMFDKIPILKPFKNAIKRYKIENVYKIYSLPFSGVYKVVGKFADKNFFVNSTIALEQKKFLEKNKTNNK